jgi:hypothetical protein
MSQHSKAPCFRGHVRKTVSPFGVVAWVSDVRTPVAFTAGPLTHTVGEAIAQAIQTANVPAQQMPDETQPLRQAA